MSAAPATARRPAAAHHNDGDGSPPDLPHRRPGAPRYSLGRALRALANRRQPDGLELEVHEELDRRHLSGNRPDTPIARGGLGIRVPLDILVERRDLTTTTGAGAVAKPTNQARLIDALRGKTLLGEFGATFYSDLAGSPYVLPKKTAASTAYWVSESNAPTESVPNFAPLNFVGRTVGGFVDVTYNTISRGGPAIERYVIDDLSRTLATEVDRAALNGSGVGQEPLGLLQDPAIPLYGLGTNGAAPTLADLCAIEKAVGDASADVGSLGWITSTGVRSKLRRTEKAAGSGFLWNDEGLVIGHPADATKHLPDNLSKGSGTNLGSLIFGNWEELIIGSWGDIFILVDPYTFGTSGTVRIIALWDVDIHPAHSESFVRVVDAVTT